MAARLAGFKIYEVRVAPLVFLPLRRGVRIKLVYAPESGLVQAFLPQDPTRINLRIRDFITFVGGPLASFGMALSAFLLSSQLGIQMIDLTYSDASFWLELFLEIAMLTNLWQFLATIIPIRSKKGNNDGLNIWSFLTSDAVLEERRAMYRNMWFWFGQAKPEAWDLSAIPIDSELPA